MTAFSTGTRGDYRLSDRSARLGGQAARLTSADAQLSSWTLERLRAESQRALRNYPTIRAVINAMRTYYVGHGVGVQARSSSKDWNKRAEKLFRRWGQQCRMGGTPGQQSMTHLQQLYITEGFVSGDIGYLAVADEQGQVKIQPIEAALICNPPGAPGAAEIAKTRGVAVVQIGDGLGGTRRYELPLGRKIVEGCEVDEWGRVHAYYVTSYDAKSGMVSKYAHRFSRVEAGSLFLMANAERVQTRGTPGLAACVDVAQYLSRVLIATVLSAEIQASQSVYITSEANAPVVPLPDTAALSGAEVLAGQVGADTMVDADNGRSGPDGGRGEDSERAVRTLEGGVEIELPPGQTPHIPAPSQPNPNLPGFVNLILRTIGGEFSLPIEVINLDLSQANFHSSRAAINLAAERGSQWQKVNLKPMLAWAWRLCIGSAIAAGEIEAVGGWEDIDVIGSGRPLLDPADDLKGFADARAANLISLRRVHATLYGSDWEEELDDMAEEKKREAELGITPALMPGAGAGPSAGVETGGGGEQNGNGR